MEILQQNLDITSVDGQMQENLSQTVAKPLSTFGTALLLSRYWYIGMGTDILGFRITDRVLHSGLVGIMSFFESTLRQYLLPNVIGSKLANFTIDMSSPFVIGTSSLLLNEALSFYYYGIPTTTSEMFYSFSFGFVSEIIGKWLYDNVIKKVTNSMLV